MCLLTHDNCSWAAGAFDDTYVLSVTPDGNTDQPLWTDAVLPNLP